jgi:hypothetical protein
MDRNVGDDGLRVPHAGSRDPLARSGDRWLGDICAKHTTARADTRRQLKNCRAGAATDVEYALARPGRRQGQQLVR